MSKRPPETREVMERIRWARLNFTEFATMTAAAESLNIKPGTYRTYEQIKAENGRAPPLSEIQRIARKFRVSWQWLATGEGTPDPDPVEQLAMFLGESVVATISRVPDEKREDAIAAVQGVLEAFARKAS